MTQQYEIQIHAHMAGSEQVFNQPDLRTRLINAIQGVLQEEAVAIGLSVQEAWEAFSVIPGNTPHTETGVALNPDWQATPGQGMSQRQKRSTSFLD